MNSHRCSSFDVAARVSAILVCTTFSCRPVRAQPADAPAVPTPEIAHDIRETVAALVEATGSDEGYLKVQGLVIGASHDLRLAQAWHEWRRAALFGDADEGNSALHFQSIEIEKLQPLSVQGGLARFAALAFCRVHLDVANGFPPDPVETWPADPWQGEFVLQKVDAPDAPWQFVVPPDHEGLVDLPERGGNRLEQALQTARRPVDMLRAARLRVQTQSLFVLISAVQRYAASTGYYPPSPYFAALLEKEPPATAPMLRRAFRVAGTSRNWVLSPAMAGKSIHLADADEALFWDGKVSGPYYLFTGRAIVGFADDRVELHSADEMKRPAR